MPRSVAGIPADLEKLGYYASTLSFHFITILEIPQKKYRGYQTYRDLGIWDFRSIYELLAVKNRDDFVKVNHEKPPVTYPRAMILNLNLNLQLSSSAFTIGHQPPGV